MVKKYNDVYFDLDKIFYISEIYYVDWIGEKGIHKFAVGINNIQYEFSDKDEKRLANLREKILKDWLKVKNESAS